jgi:hypothetical protein
MTNSIEDTLTMIYDLIEDSRTVPFINKKLIDEEQLKDLVEEIRRNIPQEIKTAQLIAGEREKILNQTQERAEQIIRNAETQARKLISEQAVMKEASRQAKEMMTKAQNKSNDVRKAIDAYVDNRLASAESELSETLAGIRQARQKYMNHNK